MSVSTLQKALLGKIESTPGTDSVPTAALNAIRIESGTFTTGIEALANQGVKQTFGDMKSNMIEKQNQLEVSFKIRSGGGLGIIPDYWPVMFSAAHTITINTVATVPVSVVMDPITTGPDTARQTSTFYWYEDGLLWKLIGAVATFQFDAPINGYITGKATIVAPYVAPTTVVLPTGITYQSSDPIKVSASDVVSEAATPISVGTFAFDAGVATDVPHMIGDVQALVTGRDKSSVTFSKRSLATAADFNRLTGLTEAAFLAQFGSAGNRFTLSASAAQYEVVTPAADGLFNNRDITLKLNETVGDDAYQITID